MTNTYDSEVFTYIEGYKPQITNAATTIGLSKEAIAGAIAEEYNAQLGSTLNELGEWFAGQDHQDLLNNYNEMRLPENATRVEDPSAIDKLFNPVLNDVGNGNIKVFTAIKLLNDYNTANPTTDPLGLKIYNNHYDQLVVDINNDSSATTAKFAGLMLKEAEVFFSTHAPDWSQYDQDYKDALLITYYNNGKARITAKYNEAISNGGTYNPTPGGEESGGLLHFQPPKYVEK